MKKREHELEGIINEELDNENWICERFAAENLCDRVSEIFANFALMGNENFVVVSQILVLAKISF